MDIIVMMKLIKQLKNVMIIVKLVVKVEIMKIIIVINVKMKIKYILIMEIVYQNQNVLMGFLLMKIQLKNVSVYMIKNVNYVMMKVK